MGELLLGKKAGYRAAAWGAVIGTLPDLDILANPFIDMVNQLYFHRNITHSLFFAIAISPVMGWLINKYHKQLDISWMNWANMTFWVILTHILIDLLTNYGTQLFQPFSDYPASMDSIFIIDPLYTLPLLFGLIISLTLRRDSSWRSTINRTGLIISTLYLVWGLAIKTHVNQVFNESFVNQYGDNEKMKTVPNGPTTFLWTGYIIQQDTIYQSLYSIFDEERDLRFQPIPRNSHYILPYSGDRAVKALMWFNRGFYTLEKESENIILYDLRFGRGDFWINKDEEYVWGNKILINESGNAHTFDLIEPDIEVRSRNLQLFWDRIWGVQ